MHGRFSQPPLLESEVDNLDITCAVQQRAGRVLAAVVESANDTSRSAQLIQWLNVNAQFLLSATRQSFILPTRSDSHIAHHEVE